MNHDTAVAGTEAATGDRGRVEDREASIKREQNKTMHQMNQCNASADGAAGKSHLSVLRGGGKEGRGR